MDLKSAAQIIRDSVSIEQILALYGYQTKRGFMPCPFHGDKDPSLKVYVNQRGHSGWHCFGCGRGGSVIDFVAEHEGCNFGVAVRAIDNALHMNLFPTNENPFEEDERRRKQEDMDLVVQAANSFCDECEQLIEIIFRKSIGEMKKISEKEIQDRSADEWTILITFNDRCQELDYQLEKISEFREEVALWRRNQRRVQSA